AVKHGRDQQRLFTDLHSPQSVFSAVFDVLGQALGQTGRGVVELDAIAAGVSQMERAVAITDRGMSARQHPGAIRDYPVAAFRPTDNAARLSKGLAGQQPGKKFPSTDYIEYQFHGVLLLKLTCRVEQPAARPRDGIDHRSRCNCRSSRRWQGPVPKGQGDSGCS